jgi:hypothetical protein
VGRETWHSLLVTCRPRTQAVVYTLHMPLAAWDSTCEPQPVTAINQTSFHSTPHNTTRGRNVLHSILALRYIVRTSGHIGITQQYKVIFRHPSPATITNPRQSYLQVLLLRPPSCRSVLRHCYANDSLLPRHVLAQPSLWRVLLQHNSLPHLRLSPALEG